jgi:hypothetical protein
MPPGVRLVDVETDRGRPKSRVCMMDLDMPAAGIVFTHNNSIPNLLRGIGERLMLVPKGDEFVLPPKPAEGVYSPGSSMADYAAAVCRKMPKMDGPLERDEFVALYDGPKRKRYEAAAASLLNRELTKEDWEINVSSRMRRCARGRRMTQPQGSYHRDPPNTVWKLGAL